MKNADAILHVDSVRLYGRLKIETLQANLKFRYEYHLRDGITTRYTFTTDAGYAFIVDYRYSTVYLQFELGALVYGHNHQLLTLEQAQAAVNQLCEETGLNLHGFEVGRLDITKDIDFTPSSLKTVRSFLNLPKYFKERVPRANGDVLFLTKRKAKNGQADRSVCIYQKGEKVRVEMRIISAPAIRRAFQIDRTLKLSDVLTSAFVEEADKYHTAITEQMTAKNSDHPLVKCFKKAALK